MTLAADGPFWAILHGEFYFLPPVCSAEIVAFDSKKMHDHILAAIYWRNIAEAFSALTFSRAGHVMRDNVPLLQAC